MLLEIIIVVTISGVMLVICATTITTLLQAQRRVSSSVQQSQVISRIRRQLRSDVHEAVSASADADGNISLTMPDKITIVYSNSEHVLKRTQQYQPDKTGQEAFRLAVGSTVSLKLLDDSKVLRCKIIRPGAPAPQTSPGNNPVLSKHRQLELDTVVSRNHRFSLVQ